MKRILILALTILTTQMVFAAGTLINGLYFNLNSDGTAEVTYKTNSDANASYVSGSLTIPSEIQNEGQTYIVTSIGSYAFRYCSELTSVIIPNSVISIGSYAFNSCSSLNDLRFEDGVDTLSLGEASYSSSSTGKGLFYYCPLKSLYLGRDLKYESTSYYGYSPFYGITTLIQVTIGNSVTSIGERAFESCIGLTSVTIPNSVTSIERSAFQNCKSIKELRFEDGEDSLKLSYNYISFSSTHKGLFYDCPLETVYLGRDLSYSNYSTYGYTPFYGITTLINVTVGNSVTTIGENLFGNTGLSSITIGESVNSIEANAFPSTLRIVTSLNPTPPTIKTNTFNSQTTKNGTLLVPEAALTNYQYAPYWNEFIKLETMPDSGSGGSGDQNGENIFNVKIDKYIYMTIDEGQAFTNYLPSEVTASSWESSDVDIVEVSNNGKAEANEYGNVIVRALDSDGETLMTLGVFVCPTVKIHYGTDKTYEHHVIYNSTPSLYLAAPEGYEIVSVSHDGEDVTETVKTNEGYYTPLSPITDDSTITVSLNSTAIPGDLNGDGKVDTADLNWLLDQMMNY